MIKWYDDLQKQIDEIQAEIDGIEAGDVDAKNLSEVLDKDAPVTLTTDLQNNKVKLGLNIDSETLEVDNGKLKVKAGGSGTKKYLHRIRIYTNYRSVPELMAEYTGTFMYLSIYNNDANAFTRETFAKYIYDNRIQNFYDITKQTLKNVDNNGFYLPNSISYSNNSRFMIQYINFVVETNENNITVSQTTVNKYFATSDPALNWEVADEVTEL